MYVFSGSLQSNRTELLEQFKGYTKISGSSASIKFGVKLHVFYTAGQKQVIMQGIKCCPPNRFDLYVLVDFVIDKQHNYAIDVVMCAMP